jgi:signal transduction histidine kinase
VSGPALADTALLVAVYTVALESEWILVAAASVILEVGVVMATVRWTPGGDDLKSLVFLTGLAIAAILAGIVVRALRSQLAWLAERAERLELERDQQASLAAAAERARIAREMHDIVAHRISNIVLTASALQVSPPARSAPDVARAAEDIRDEGHQALEELRDTLGILTPGRDRRQAPRAPQPDVSQLHRLVERATSRGQDARLEVNGHPEILPTPVQRAIYRIAQETLTNVAKHAPGATVTLAVDCRLDGVHINVVNGPPARPVADGLPSGGNGLIGLRERATLLGGTLTAGPHENGGFEVEVYLPPHPGAPRVGENHGTP